MATSALPRYSSKRCRNLPSAICGEWYLNRSRCVFIAGLKIAVTGVHPSLAMSKTGVSTSLRRLFAKIRVNECNGDITPTDSWNAHRSVSLLAAAPGAVL